MIWTKNETNYERLNENLIEPNILIFISLSPIIQLRGTILYHTVFTLMIWNLGDTYNFLQAAYQLDSYHRGIMSLGRRIQLDH